MSTPSPIGIVGLGLIGGSLGLALREAGVTVLGFDRDADAARKAHDTGCVSEVRTLEGLSECPLVVLCVPPDAVGRVALELGGILAPDAVLTDATSVKQEVLSAFSRVPNPTRCVGGHPMAGLERTGSEFARADLYRGARWILTPLPNTSPDALARVWEMVAAVGAIPVEMSPLVHDREVAYLSHLPHAIAAAMMNLVGEVGYPEAAGGSWRDATRVGGVDPDLWTQILMANRQEVAKAISDFDHRITLLRHALASGDREAVHQFLLEARAAKEAQSNA